ncbi:MAG: AmmeMemoRadiSam system radical SAM enzyme [Candidatus Aenigmatarchaeota archaeon]
MKDAMFYDKTLNNTVQCQLCPRNCIIMDGKRGVCGVRENQGGKLVSLVYGKAISAAVDPIEKKPFFHFAPGSKTLSAATVGCNLKCGFCQNWEISQKKDIVGDDLSPEDLIAIVKKNEINGFSWTYTEPTIFFEYYHDTALLAKNRKLDLFQTWVSNGFTNEDVVKLVAQNLDAINIDLKGDDEFYKKLCDGWIEPIHRAIKLYHKLGVWIELTNLIVPNQNDSDMQIKELCEWIINNVGPDVPIHFSRYRPDHKLDEPTTPEATLERAFQIAKKIGINYVYVGNVHNSHENTVCPNCGRILIERRGFSISKIDLVEKNEKWCCPGCNHDIPVTGMEWSRL